MVAVCVTEERPLYFASSFFFFFSILSDVCTLISWKLHHTTQVRRQQKISPLHLLRCPLKEIRGQKPRFGDFFGHRIKILQYHSVMRRNFIILKQYRITLMFTRYVYQTFLVYKCLHGSAPAYLTDELCQVADVEARQRLRSSSSSSLIVSRTRLSTVGDRAFPVTAARVWNSLPDLVTSAPSVAVFRSRLKTHLFNISYPSPL